MKAAVRLSQVLVGLLFIFSGLIKANDPIGLSFKMQEFFELWSAGAGRESFLFTALSFLHDGALSLSVLMITLEVLAGVALLLGWKKKAVLWLLLLLIVFFTFLTGYAYLSGKFTNCGCFGDCLPISPLTSFLKDILLTALILFLFFGQRYITSMHASAKRWTLLSGSLLSTLGLQWYVLKSLPLADCLPFKKGNNIMAQMKPPAGSLPDSFAIRFLYEKGGKQYEFAPENLPADFTTYKFINRKQTLIRKGNAEPPIKEFSLVDSAGNNTAPAILSEPIAVLVFAMDFKTSDWIADLKILADSAGTKGLNVYVVSPSMSEGVKAISPSGLSNIIYFNADFTLVRTIARTNPVTLFLNKGTIVKKYSKAALRQAAVDISAQSF